MHQLKSTELSVIASNSPIEAAKILNFPRSRVYRTRKRYGLSDKRRKYSAEDIAAIMERRSAGESYGRIALDYDTNRVSLYRAVKNAEEKGFSSYPKRNDN